MDDWNEFLEESKTQFPNPLDDSRRIQKGRGWKRRSGMIEPSTPESAAACKEYLRKMYENLAHEENLNANISRHKNEKARRRESVMADAIEIHAVETGLRYAKHRARAKDPNRYDLLIFILFITFCCIAVWLTPQIARGL